jgi:hypothetical protein
LKQGWIAVSFRHLQLDTLPKIPTSDKHERELNFTCKNAQVVTGLQTSCYKSVHKLSTNCVRTACSQLLKQVWSKLLINLLLDLLQGCSNKSDTVMHDITARLMTQGCNNIVIS